MQTYRSRKRKTETALKNLLLDLFQEGLDGVQVLVGRETTDQDATHVRIHCGQSEPREDETETITGYKVNGTITVETSADDSGRTVMDQIEGIVESFVEIEHDELVSLINQQEDVAQFGVWHWHPVGSEDGLDEEKRRFVSRYDFTAWVDHEPRSELIT